MQSCRCNPFGGYWSVIILPTRLKRIRFFSTDDSTAGQDKNPIITSALQRARRKSVVKASRSDVQTTMFTTKILQWAHAFARRCVPIWRFSHSIFTTSFPISIRPTSTTIGANDTNGRLCRRTDNRLQGLFLCND